MSKPWISKESLEKFRKKDALLKNVSCENDQIEKVILRNDYKN